MTICKFHAIFINEVNYGKNFSDSKYKTKSKKDGFDTSVIKAIKLLELNNIDLDNYLEQEVLENTHF